MPFPDLRRKLFLDRGPTIQREEEEAIRTLQDVTRRLERLQEWIEEVRDDIHRSFPKCSPNEPCGAADNLVDSIVRLRFKISDQIKILRSRR